MCDDANGKPKSDDENDLSASDDSSEPEEVPNNAPFDPEFDEEDDEDDCDKVIETPPQDGSQKMSPFSLKGGSSSFSSRSHNIFDCLDTMAKLTSSSLGQDNVIDGVFARPVAPPPPSRKTSQPPPTSPTPAKKRGKPDYLVNPDRWTHYSLEDVPETSDQGNSRVAHQFLAGLKHKKDDTEVEEPHDGQQKIIFSKPTKMGKEQAANKLEKGSKEKKMRLSHLDEDEEDEEEDYKEVRKRQKLSTKNIDLKMNEAQSAVEKEQDEVDSGFVAFKKSRKAYRKTTEET